MATPTTTNKYDLLRNKARQTAKSEQDQQSDAMQRRFAALGRGGSGAAIKNQMDIEQKGAQNVQNSVDAIGFQEAAEQERNAQIEADRAFQRGEREASQKFVSGESALQRKFARNERLGTQNFAANESRRARNLQNQQFKQTMLQNKDQFNKQFETLYGKDGLEIQKFKLDEEISRKNLELQEKLANQKGILDRILSGDLLKGTMTGGLSALGDLFGGRGGNIFGGGGGGGIGGLFS